MTNMGPINSAESLLAYHDYLSTKAAGIMARKNKDYTCSTKDPFANFRLSEVMLDVPGELGLLMRVLDKFQRLKSFIAHNSLAVSEETVEDAILDVINYMVLLGGMLKSRNKGGSTNE